MIETQEKRSVHKYVNGRIIELLKGKVIPWEKHWTHSGIPANLISGIPYAGSNLILLNSLGYQQNFFLIEKLD